MKELEKIQRQQKNQRMKVVKGKTESVNRVERLKDLYEIMDSGVQLPQDKKTLQESYFVKFASIADKSGNIYIGKNFKLFPAFFQYFTISTLHHLPSSKNYLRANILAIQDCMRKQIDVENLLLYYVKYLKCQKKSEEIKQAFVLFSRLKKETKNFKEWNPDLIKL